MDRNQAVKLNETNHELLVSRRAAREEVIVSLLEVVEGLAALVCGSGAREPGTETCLLKLRNLIEFSTQMYNQKVLRMNN